MSALSKKLSLFCYSNPRLGVPNLMKYIAIGNVIVFFLDIVFHGQLSMLLSFNPHYIINSFQIWRLVTFIIVPTASDPFFFALSVYLYYSIGSTLERYWGTTRFTVYYFLGAIINAVAGMVGYFISPTMFPSFPMEYVNESLFLAFATIFAETVFYVFMIIPIKAKWLALISSFVLVYQFVTCLSYGMWGGAIAIVASVFNYLLFFWDDLKYALKKNKSNFAHQNSAQTVNFRKAQREVQKRKGHLHQCTVCGITDADNPDMEFRYCSKCTGYHCYCSDHINNHEHKT